MQRVLCTRRRLPLLPACVGGLWRHAAAPACGAASVSQRCRATVRAHAVAVAAWVELGWESLHLACRTGGVRSGGAQPWPRPPPSCGPLRGTQDGGVGVGPKGSRDPAQGQPRPCTSTTSARERSAGGWLATKRHDHAGAGVHVPGRRSGRSGAHATASSAARATLQRGPAAPVDAQEHMPLKTLQRRQHCSAGRAGGSPPNATSMPVLGSTPLPPLPGTGAATRLTPSELRACRGGKDPSVCTCAAGAACTAWVSVWRPRGLRTTGCDVLHAMRCCSSHVRAPVSWSG